MSKGLSLLFVGLLFLVMADRTLAETEILPFTKGSFAEIKAQRHNKPFILVFWSETCSYCLVELAMFGKLQKQYPEVEIVTVATDSFLEDEAVFQVLKNSGLRLEKTWVFAEQFPEIIYADINKRWRGELPATYFFDRNNQQIRHMGMIKEEELIDWMTEQTG